MTEEDYRDQLLNFGPLAWAALSLGVWVCYVLAQGWGKMGRWDRHHLLWGLLSISHFLYYVLFMDKTFQVRNSC
jgi:hypothetical protein